MEQKKQFSPLQQACRASQIDLLKIEELLNENADPNSTDLFGNTCLHIACLNKSEAANDLVVLLLKYRADPNILNQAGFYCLNYVCSFAHFTPQTVEALLNKFDDKLKNCQEIRQKQSLLHTVITRNFEEILNGDKEENIDEYHNIYKITELLLKKGCDPNLQDHKGNTVLHYVCQYDFFDVGMIQLLMDYAASVNIKNRENKTAYQFSDQNKKSMIDSEQFKKFCLAGKIEYHDIEYFIKLKVDINLIAIDNKTCKQLILEKIAQEKTIEFEKLMLTAELIHEICSKNPKIPLIEKLIQQGAQVNFELVTGDSLLHIACQNGNKEVIYFLLSNHINPNKTNKEGDNCLFTYLCENDDLDIVLIAKMIGKDVNIINLKNIEGISAFHFICYHKNTNFELINLFIQKGGNLNFKTRDNKKTPFHLACQNEKITAQIIEAFLIQDTIDPNIKSGEGKIAKDYITENEAVKNKEALKKLFEVCPIDKDGKTFLHRAILNKEKLKSITSKLIKGNKLINVKDNSGNTVLHYAYAYYQEDKNFIDLLLKNGADETIKNSNGQLPKDCIPQKIFVDSKNKHKKNKKNPNKKSNHHPTLPVKEASQSKSSSLSKRNANKPKKKQANTHLENFKKISSDENHSKKNKNEKKFVNMDELSNKEVEIDKIILNDPIKPLNFNQIKEEKSEIIETNEINDFKRINLEISEENLKIIQKKSEKNATEILTSNSNDSSMKNKWKNATDLPLIQAIKFRNLIFKEYFLQTDPTIEDITLAENVKAILLKIKRQEKIEKIDATMDELFKSNFFKEDQDNKEDYILFCFLMQGLQAKPIDYKLCAIFLSKMHNVNFQDGHQRTIFHYLCQKKAITIEMMQLFLEKINLNLKDAYGNTPLMYLLKNTSVQLDFIKLLVEKGADLETVNNYSHSCLHAARLNKKDNPNIVNFLAEKKTNKNQTDCYGNTPFHYGNYSISQLPTMFQSKQAKRNTIQRPPPDNPKILVNQCGDIISSTDKMPELNWNVGTDIPFKK